MNEFHSFEAFAEREIARLEAGGACAPWLTREQDIARWKGELARSKQLTRMADVFVSAFHGTRHEAHDLARQAYELGRASVLSGLALEQRVSAGEKRPLPHGEASSLMTPLESARTALAACSDAILQLGFALRDPARAELGEAWRGADEAGAEARAARAELATIPDRVAKARDEALSNVPCLDPDGAGHPEHSALCRCGGAGRVTFEMAIEQAHERGYKACQADVLHRYIEGTTAAGLAADVIGGLHVGAAKRARRAKGEEG